MITQDKFEHTLALLYKAALGDVPWVSAGALVNDMVRTNGNSLTYADLSRGGRARDLPGTICRRYATSGRLGETVS